MSVGCCLILCASACGLILYDVCVFTCVVVCLNNYMLLDVSLGIVCLFAVGQFCWFGFELGDCHLSLSAGLLCNVELSDTVWFGFYQWLLLLIVLFVIYFCLFDCFGLVLGSLLCLFILVVALMVDLVLFFIICYVIS